MNARGRLLTIERWNKVTSSRRSTFDKINFEDSSYELTVQNEDHVKEENRKEKELHVLKWQLKEEHELDR